MSPRWVDIHYRRLPDRLSVFRQRLVEETAECSVTLVGSVNLPRPVTAGERTILEPGAPVVWFTFPGEWFDVGRFHLLDGSFTGYYANLLTPVEMDGDRWQTTDLCLDLWMDASGAVEMLDVDEFDEALSRGWMDEATASSARRHADALEARARAGHWPPEPVLRWPLERARSELH